MRASSAQGAQEPVRFLPLCSPVAVIAVLTCPWLGREQQNGSRGHGHGSQRWQRGPLLVGGMVGDPRLWGQVVILPVDWLLPSCKRDPGSESPQLCWVPLSWAVSLWGICFLICCLGTSWGSGDCGQGLPHLDIW